MQGKSISSLNLSCPSGRVKRRWMNAVNHVDTGSLFTGLGRPMRFPQGYVDANPVHSARKSVWRQSFWKWGSSSWFLYFATSMKKIHVLQKWIMLTDVQCFELITGIKVSFSTNKWKWSPDMKHYLIFRPYSNVSPSVRQSVSGSTDVLWCRWGHCRIRMLLF